MASKFKIILLLVFAILSIIFWDYAIMRPIKIFVVFLHEISHGLGAILTGGKVSAISIEWSEAGATHSIPGNFLATASAGYLGSILWGSLMLLSSLKNRFTRGISGVIGLLLFFFTAFYLKPFELSIGAVGIGWGILIIFSALMHNYTNRFLLFILGGLTSIYAVYDLSDFFKGEVMQTDAGIIAKHYLREPSLQVALAYVIGILISVLSVWILYSVIRAAVKHDHEEQLAVHEEPSPAAGLDDESMRILALMQEMEERSRNNQP